MTFEDLMALNLPVVTKVNGEDWKAGQLGWLEDDQDRVGLWMGADAASFVEMFPLEDDADWLLRLATKDEWLAASEGMTGESADHHVADVARRLALANA